ncbi:MAG: BA14K family protein [bacterium]
MPAFKSNTLSAVGAVGLLLAVGTTGASAQSAYCDSVARDYASQHAHGGDVVGGAVGGAVTGAILGGIIGGKKGAGTGAAIGGGVGAVGGAANQSQRWQSLYHHAYNDCMARETSARAPAYSGSPEPWTEEWYIYCENKYRSFNPETGMFLAYSGEYKMCR